MTHSFESVFVSLHRGTGGNAIITDDVETAEVYTRPFTEVERRGVKRTFIVPSQNGLAVCFRKKNGGEDFMPLDEKSIGQAWDEVNLKHSVVVTYKDGVKKLRIQHQNSRTIFDLFPKMLSNAFH